jgi:phage terminase large subunit GpA-like protein
MVRGVPQEYAAILAIVRGDKNNKGKERKYRKRFYNLAVSVLKLHLYRGLKKTDPEAMGYVHFAAGLPDEYFVQLVSERRTPEKTRNGVVEYRWKLPEGVRNEALDTMNAAQGAAYRLGIFQWDEDDWDALAARLEVPPASPQLDLEDEMMAAPGGRAPAGQAATAPPLQNNRVAAALARAAAAKQRQGQR